METYIDYLLRSFKTHIANIDWMSPDTKVKAQEKLSKFTVKIAYPDKWKDYTQLKVESPKQGLHYIQIFRMWQLGSIREV